MSRADRHASARRALLGVLAVLLAVHAGRSLLGASGPVIEPLAEIVAFNGLLLGAAAACLWRALAVREDRWAWGIFGAGMLLWACGEVLWTTVLGGDSAPVPSVADALWLAFYPCAYAGLVLMVRARARDFRPSMWLDGVTSGLGAATAGAALLVPAVRGTLGGHPAEVATNLAYPLADLVLLALVAGMLSLLGWRPGRMWGLLAAGLALNALADGVYLYQSAVDAYHEGAIVDSLWPAAALLMAAAAWAPPSRTVTVRPGTLALLGPTVVASLAALAVLAIDHFRRLDGLAVALATATLCAVVVRATLAFRENERALEEAGRRALTDPLTGLGNRLALSERLREALGRAAGGPGTLLVVFDLDGFKGYNDAFGHPAGDALLQRLGAKLHAAAGPRAGAYRLGGDEFCVVAPLDGADPEAVIDAAARALREEGEGFSIGASFGAAFLPEEAGSPADALRVADRRLYASKRGRRASADWQAQSALSQALREREPGLLGHAQDVVELALEVGRRLGVEEPQLQDVARAAALHDVGKLAIPDAILRKPGPLTDAERALMRAHPVIGERIVAAAPALASVSRLVRSSHERWDGAGYPDGLAGRRIPLGSRIVAACAAFDAMTSDRGRRPAMGLEDALAELARRAGTRFDPRVAGALAQAVRERSRAGRAAVTGTGGEGGG